MSDPGFHPLRFVWQMDAEGRFTVGSEDFVALVGPRTAAVLGEPWHAIAAALDLDRDGRIARAMATQDTWSGLAVAWPIDDGSRHLMVELSGLPVFDRDRMFRGYRGFGVCRDLAPVTTVAESAAPQAENVVPFRAPAADATAPALSPVEHHAFRELSRRLTERLNEPGGEPAAVAESAAAEPAFSDHAAPSAFVLAPDAAELTEARQQADKAAAAKSDFLARISHEIRDPLNAIIGFSEVMIEERFGPIGNERYRQYLRDIHTSGGHLISLINDLLDLSKIEAGKLELAFAAVALDDLAQQCVALMQPQANRERIIIRTSLSPKLPPIVADARSVKQIVLNLVSNSIKYTGAGGQVIVSTALTDLGEVVLRVRDTGVGMSDEDIATALEPFRQLATSARLHSGGTGLGLPLTKALAEANRAGFRITSARNAGTLVEVTFPAARVVAGS